MTKTTRKPLQKYNPGSLDEADLESLKMSVNEELWDISTNFVQTDEILGDVFEKTEALEIDRDKMNAKIEEYWHLSVEGDKSLAERINTLSADFEDNSASVKDSIKVLTDADSALAERINKMEAEIGDDIRGAINEEARVRAEADGVLAEKITKLTADMESEDSNLSSQITNTNKVVSDLDKTVATNKTELSSSIDDLEKDVDAKLAVVNQTIADGDKAVSSQVTNIKAEFDGKIAGVNQELSATVDKLGNVESKWGVTVNGETGAIGGVSLIGGGDNRSEFCVEAHAFKFVDQSGNKSGGFESSGGVTKFTGSLEVQDNAGNVGMKIRNNQILIFDEAGRLRVRMGYLG